MTPLEIVLLGLATILLISCVGLVILYRHCAMDSIRLEWLIENEGRWFNKSNFLRWQTENGFKYELINGRHYRAVIDSASEVKT